MPIGGKGRALGSPWLRRRGSQVGNATMFARQFSGDSRPALLADFFFTPASASLAASCQAVATATASIALGKPLGAAPAATASATAALALSVPLSASATASAAATAALSLTVPLLASATAQATATAGLTLSVTLAASPAATATASAALDLVVPLVAAASALATASAALDVTVFYGTPPTITFRQVRAIAMGPAYPQQGA